MNNAAEKQELVVTGTMPVPQAASESAAVISMIERAARDPSVDIDKLTKLIELRSQVEAKEAERAFDEAMTAAQAEMRPVAADSNNSQTKSKYASYQALDKALRPIYSKHGMALSFNTEPAPIPDYVRVKCRVSRGGHSRDYQIDMPADGKGAKGGDVMTKTHATGSAVSYGMRYLLKMIFNIAVGEDDDGNAAGGGGALINEQQQEQITKLIADTKSDITKFLAWLKVESISDIPQAKFGPAVDRLQQKQRKVQS